ncbi:MAG: molecular chaperone HtpG [Planctomycetota bacterium]|nr:molecular chaperone HtpG [Planctomycetota bacterium]
MTTQQTETRRFEAEVQELLGLMIHSLYTEKDIFLRELISNASDACDKLRIEALTNEGLLAADEELQIRLEADKEARTLSVIDNGIGMSRDELAENLGTIARSGTRAFLERLKEAKGEAAAELIGQFGVGFYSSFMVADEVVVTSRRAGSDTGARWASKADGTYTLEDTDVAERGTRVTLHLKPLEGEGDADTDPDFTDSWTLRSVVKRHSDFVEHPIRMEVERQEPELDDEGKPKEGGATKTVVSTETLNSRKPLWSRDPKEIEDEEYNEFYRHIAHDFSEPGRVVHLRAEVPVEFSALLYVPKQKAMMFAEDPQAKSKLLLYVKRVLIMPDCADLLPPWLRFVRGVVDCPDLPLNVSRQTLQANPITRRIQKHLVSKVLGALGEMLEKEREDYETFFDAHGRVLKEGIYQGADDDQRLSKLCLFPSSTQDELTTLGGYVERMPEDQEAIWYLAGMDRETAAASPHLEAFRAKDREVLLMTDPVDEWMLQRLQAFDEKPLKAVDRGEVDLEDDTAKEAREAQEAEHKDLLQAMRAVLQEDVAEVRFSSRLKDSAAVLVGTEGGVSPAMERVMREVQGMDLPKTKRVLELNAEHPVVARLQGFHADEARSQDLEDYTRLLYGQALIAEGSPVPDPAGFAKLVTRLMVGAGA